MEGRLILPRLDIRSNISFCVDTGADECLLMPIDGDRISIDYRQLAGDVEMVGVGGISSNFIEPAVLAFSETRRNVYLYHLDLQIAAPSPDIGDLPSLLGRNILNKWRMNYNPMGNRLTFTVLSADHVIPLS